MRYLILFLTFPLFGSDAQLEVSIPIDKKPLVSILKQRRTSEVQRDTIERLNTDLLESIAQRKENRMKMMVACFTACVSGIGTIASVIYSYKKCE